MKHKLSQIMVATSALMLGGFTSSGRTQAPRAIDITAARFAFEPAEITVKKGEDVMLTLHSSDVSHGLLIEDLGVRVEVPKGESKSVKLKTDAAGDYIGKCAHFCGSGHGSMTLFIHVVE